MWQREVEKRKLIQVGEVKSVLAFLAGLLVVFVPVQSLLVKFDHDLKKTKIKKGFKNGSELSIKTEHHTVRLQ